MFQGVAFYHKGNLNGPSVTMTDNYDELKDAVWPKSCLLLCIFHMMEQLKNNVILEDNKKLKQRVINIEEINRKLEDDLADMEIEVAKQDRYSPRNNMEIGGIPDHFNGDQLEDVAIAILNKLDVKCVSNDLEACHRLPLTKKEKNSGHPKRTLLRFVNRRFGELALTSRKN